MSATPTPTATQGCRMRYRSPYGTCGLPHPHPHYHMYYPHPRHMSPHPPMYYVHGPPRHMMPPLHPYHRHPHIRPPMMPAYPSCYPYQHNTEPFMGSPGTPTLGTHSWNQYKHAVQKSVPQRYSPARSHEPRVFSPLAENTNVSEETSDRGKGKHRRKNKKQNDDGIFSPAYSDVEDRLNPSSEENQSKRRSKYRTLLRELAVNNHAATVFNNNTTPHNLRRAITMYIDYLTQMNESHVKVAEFNTAQDFPPEFELEEYYHKALNEDIHFPSPLFRTWLACYGVRIDVIDDPDGTEPGQKIIKITTDPSYSRAEAEQNLLSLEKQIFNGSLSVCLPYEEQIAVGESYATVVLPDLDPVGVPKKRSTKRNVEPIHDSLSLVDSAVGSYLPPRKSCTEKRKAKIASETNPKRGRPPPQNQMQYIPPANVGLTGSPMYASPSPNTSQLPNTNVETTALNAEPTVVNNESADIICIGDAFLNSPAGNRNKLPQLIPYSTPKKGIQSNQVIDSGMSGLQLNQNIGDSAFVPYNAELQRGLHTPIFDELGSTPFKEFSAQTQSGHIQLNDPVLIETASKRDKNLPRYQQLSSEESSNDSTGSNDLEGIEVLQSPPQITSACLTEPIAASIDSMETSAESESAANIASSTPNAANCSVEFQCPFTGENLTRQVQAALANKVEVQYFM